MLLYRFGDFELDADSFQLRRAGRLVEIAPKAFDLLLYMISQPRRTLSRAELVREVWQAEAVSDSSVPTCITAVRRALDDDPEQPEYVETVRGRGYRFVAPVTSQEYDPERPGTPPTSRPEHSAAFVGRQIEMDAMSAGLARALGGTPQAFLLLGEAGIGKTRLLDEFARLSEAREARALVGRCREDAGAPAFWPWVQILRSFIDVGSSAAKRLLEPYASVILQILPELTELFPGVAPLPQVGAEQAKFRLLDAITNLVEASARLRPVVIIIDDLHRADAASLLLLEFMVRELRNSPVFILCAYRDLEVHVDDQRGECLARIARLAPTRSIQLKGLSRKAIGEMVGRPEDAQLVQELHEQSGGNPFFLTQLVQILEIEPESERSEARRRFDLPAGVRDTIAMQLNTLPNETRRALAVAAVTGREFSVAIIARALGGTVPETLGWLAPTKTARLIEDCHHQPGSLRFSHALLRDVVYEQIDIAERAQIHRKIGEALEAIYFPALDPCIEDLAYHFAQSADVADPNKAIDYCVRAGEHATAHLAHENAPGHFRRALDLMNFQPAVDAAARCELLLRLGAAEMRSGHRESAKLSLRRAAVLAREIDAPILLARAALGMAPGFFTIEVGVSDAELASLIIEAETALPDTEVELRALLMARLAMDAVWSDSPERSDHLSRTAIELIGESQNPIARAHALSARHGALWGPENFEARKLLISEIGELARTSNNAEISLMHRVLSITALLELGEIADVDIEIREYTRLANHLRLPHAEWFIALFRAMRALMSGQYNTAAANAQSFLELGNRVQDQNAPLSFAAQLVLQRLEQNRIEEILSPLSKLASDFPAIQAWQCASSFFRSEVNDQRASQIFETIAQAGFGKIPRNETWSISMNMLSNACVNLGDVERAAELYELILPGKMHFTIVGYGVLFWGSRARELGNLASLMGRFAEAEEHLELAIAQNAKTGAVPWVARSEYDLAKMLVRKGDPSDRWRARELAESAQSVARKLPMQRLVLETTELLRRLD